mmetsp:Transcript_3721/g.6577  ORF Transcript_3721/g.6577 Transcript_3721/m.6577 type:complete len:292 (-) Transcript_3721:42-917(-)
MGRFFRQACSILPPPPPPRLAKFDLHKGAILIQGKPHYHLYKHKIPRHAHPDLHPRSFDLWRYSSFFSRLSFSWPNGLVNIRTYEFFNTMDERMCSLCNSIHAFDALSCLAQCHQLNNTLRLAFDVWHPQAQQIVKEWFRRADRDDKCKFVRTLLPQSLIDLLQGIDGLSISDILKHRKPLLQNLLKEQFQQLCDRPAPPNHARKGPVNHYQTNTASVVPPPKRYRPPRGIAISFEIQPPQAKKKRKRAGTPPPVSPDNHGNGPNPPPQTSCVPSEGPDHPLASPRALPTL